jgi:glycogen operon protein
MAHVGIDVHKRESQISGTTRRMKSVVVDPSACDWEDDAPLRQPFARTIVYEMHVRGFTRHPSSGVLPRTRPTAPARIRSARWTSSATW